MALQKQIGLSVFAVTPRAGVWIETISKATLGAYRMVTPRAGVWIETARGVTMLCAGRVTPRAGVWIETKARSRIENQNKMSLPVRECGLKLEVVVIEAFRFPSLPVRECGLKLSCCWISISFLSSLPVRECGLKHVGGKHYIKQYGHSPCGSVD